jgi:hypothetical protein
MRIDNFPQTWLRTYSTRDVGARGMATSVCAFVAIQAAHGVFSVVQSSNRRIMRKSLATIGLSILVVSTAFIGTANASGSFTNQSTTVSCDGSTYQTAEAMAHSVMTTPISITQNLTSPTSSSRVYLTDASGNATGSGLWTDGVTLQWGSLAVSTWTIHVRREGALNCNGSGLGHGNYNWVHSASY